MKNIFFIFISLIIYSNFASIVHANSIELFTDPNFQNGIAVGYANTYPNSADQTCIDRWKQILPGYNSAKWMFIEISERFYFCDNPNNNPAIGTNIIQYVSPNAGIKKFTSDRNGTIRMEHDTSWEWRGGCNLSLPWLDVNPSQPKYGDSYTNWPHFLISQVLSPSFSQLCILMMVLQILAGQLRILWVINLEIGHTLPNWALASRPTPKN